MKIHYRFRQLYFDMYFICPFWRFYVQRTESLGNISKRTPYFERDHGLVRTGRLLTGPLGPVVESVTATMLVMFPQTLSTTLRQPDR